MDIALVFLFSVSKANASACDADLPRRELLVAQAQQLTLGALAGGRGKDLQEDAFAHALYGGGTVEDLAAADVIQPRGGFGAIVAACLPVCWLARCFSASR
ncbi:hypothetical protein CS8_004180 [Cupriavidus sp. 8B]